MRAPRQSWRGITHLGKAFSILAVTALTLATGSILWAASGDLDPTFGTGGVAHTHVGGTDTARAVAVRSDGKILVGGTTTLNNDCAVIRYNPDGTLDPTFGSDGLARFNLGGADLCYDLALQADNSIVVAGQTAGPRLAAARLTPDGALDTTFNGTGVYVDPNTSLANRLAIQPDGKIVIAGSVAGAGSGGEVGIRVVRLTSGGTLDTTFGGTGFFNISVSGLDLNGYDLAIQPDGQIVVGGQSAPQGAGRPQDFNLFRVRADGSGLDAGFGTAGRYVQDLGADDQLLEIALQADGAIIAAGNKVSGSASDLAAIRVTSAGTLDTSFGTGGTALVDFGSFDTAQRVAIQPDGKIVLAGFSGFTGNADLILARLLSSGALDTTFGTNGQVRTNIAATDVGYGLALQADGKILVAGSDGADFVVARFQNDVAATVTATATATGPAGSATATATATIAITGTVQRAYLPLVVRAQTVTGW